MQLAGRGPDRPPATDLAEALRRSAADRGHRPALTVLGAGPHGERRDEQAFASLHQWVAKGAHLLEVDVGLGPGDVVHLDAPPGWLAASICLAAWWVGAAVSNTATGSLVSLVHESRVDGPIDGWVIGDAVDGSASAPGLPESWALAVQAFPDQPPMPRASATSIAVLGQGGALTATQLLERARELPGGRVGTRAGRQWTPNELLLTAIVLAARPVATGEPSVLVLGDPTEAAIRSEQVSDWVTSGHLGGDRSDGLK